MTLQDKIKKGEELVKTGRVDQAKKLFEQVLELEPRHLRALNNLAVLSIASRRLEEAGEYLAISLAVDSEDLRTLHNVLSLEMLKQNWPAARAAAGRLITLEPGRGNILKAAVKIEIAAGDYLAAVKRAEELLDYFPGDSEAVEMASLAYYKVGDYDKARAGLKSLLTADPAREDLSGRLALLNFPEKINENDLWPDPSRHEPLAVAAIYRQIWAGIPGEALIIKAARTLGHLSDPGSLGDEDLPLNPPPPVDASYRPRLPAEAADVAGLSIMFAPTIIAGQSAMLAAWLKRRGVDAVNLEMFRTYLGYDADYYLLSNRPDEIQDFTQSMMQEAEKRDILCLDFGSSLTYFPNFIVRQDHQPGRESDQPYADLIPLKEKGVKIFFAYWGSDCSNQSVFPYYYLHYLGFEDLPRPPEQTRYQYKNVMAADLLADAVIGCGFDRPNLPRFVPFREVCLEPKMWPFKKNYRKRVEKILTAPTNPRKKNYTLTQAVLESVLARHPEVSPFRVQGMPHDTVARLYAEADVGIDQIARGFGTFSVEMMALGLPVISSRQKYFSHRDMAPVLAFDNIRGLSDRLRECIENPDILPGLGKQGREYALEYHSIEVGGRVFSHYLAEAAAGGRVPHVISETYEEASLIWDQDPENVYCFKFYDMAVPLMCALGEYEYGLYLCSDAVDCDYRPEKFMAWQLAIRAVVSSDDYLPIYSHLPPSPSLDSFKKEYTMMLKDSKALLKEYEAMSKEAADLKKRLETKA